MAEIHDRFRRALRRIESGRSLVKKGEEAINKLLLEIDDGQAMPPPMPPEPITEEERAEAVRRLRRAGYVPKFIYKK
jgi:hypothetical protein